MRSKHSDPFVYSRWKTFLSPLFHNWHPHAGVGVPPSPFYIIPPPPLPGAFLPFTPPPHFPLPLFILFLSVIPSPKGSPGAHLQSNGSFRPSVTTLSTANVSWVTARERGKCQSDCCLRLDSGDRRPANLHWPSLNIPPRFSFGETRGCSKL